ncbi:ROK family transcriptional regulator [Tanticharoenia sakaeratensis]|uniref:Transcriptional regulator protein n=1 Tax=Tanticharoenia sakaeratensis NBRC 103193 TaxID=1231623 RepID=A0A0D6MKN1_9PROT|nr:ROK family transcriptional regulator [Tanticharoenia sakaeratensis]GAN54031.1 transcriptional regulator protein [Tanticharoenia sakaeratensis NBRC 103193]GBQ23640.1 ROK family protein [Tanticharoenia sakaeratensis NBRC 103193]
MFSAGHHRILSTLSRLGAMSRTDLARALDVSKASISMLVRDLIARGVLREEAVVFGQGRPSITLGLCSDAASFIGISLHADPTTVVMTDPHGRILARYVMPRETDPHACFEGLARAVDIVRKRAGSGAGPIAGIGVAQPGFVSRDGRISLASTALGWVNVDVAGGLSAVTGLPVFVENDANALILGEQLFGPSGDCPDFSLVFVGDGIGSAHIVNGRLHRGHHGGAGEISHSPIALDGSGALPCRCGNRGCLETVSSLQAIRGAARQAGLTSDIDELAAMTADGHPEALAILHRAGAALGIALAQLVQMFDPSQVLVILDPALKDSVFGRVLRQEMETHVLRRAGVQTTLTLRGLEDDSFAKGAASLAAQKFLFGNEWT